MPQTIWKFPLKVTDAQVVQIPQRATILSCQIQYDALCLWALVDPMAPQESRTVRIFGTGHSIPDDPLTYVGTVQMHDGSLVWHVFLEVF